MIAPPRYMTESNIGGILLAAGGSSRLGEPKQFIVYKGKTLIRRAAETLLASGCSPVVVVVGDDERSISELESLEVHIVRNEEWRSGMGSSLKLGLARVLEINAAIEAVVVILCDQPFVTSAKIEELCSDFRVSYSQIVAAEYNGTRGVPALFSRDTFSELSSIPNEKGARDLIRSSDFTLLTVEMPEAALDIDTQEDVQHLKT